MQKDCFVKCWTISGRTKEENCTFILVDQIDFIVLQNIDLDLNFERFSFQKEKRIEEVQAHFVDSLNKESCLKSLRTINSFAISYKSCLKIRPAVLSNLLFFHFDYLVSGESLNSMIMYLSITCKSLLEIGIYCKTLVLSSVTKQKLLQQADMLLNSGQCSYLDEVTLFEFITSNREQLCRVNVTGYTVTKEFMSSVLSSCLYLSNVLLTCVDHELFACESLHDVGVLKGRLIK